MAVAASRSHDSAVPTQILLVFRVSMKTIIRNHCTRKVFRVLLSSIHPSMHFYCRCLVSDVSQLHATGKPVGLTVT